MKKINIFILAIVALLGFNSCTDDDTTIVAQAISAPELIVPDTGTSIILTDANATNPALTLVWNEADYGTSLAISYKVELAISGTAFETPILGGTTNEQFITWTVEQLNTVAVAAGLTPFSEGDLEVRVISSIGSPAVQEQTSNTLVFTVTPYTSELPQIGVPGNHQGWDPPTAPRLASPEFGATNYEGYVWLDGGYKFIAPDDSGNYAWGNTDWGDDGSFSGILVEDGESNCEAPTAGYYFIQADTAELTYSATQYSWGLIGSATPSGWDSDQDMTYDAASKTWTITLDLTADEIKFRANDAWDWNYGDDGADNILENGAANIVVPAAGNYTVVLDLSKPREYTYSLTLN